MRTDKIDQPTVPQRLASFRRGLLLFVAAVIPLAYLPGVTNDVYQVPKTSLLLMGTALAGVVRIIELFLGASARGLRRALVPAGGLGMPLVLAWLASPYRDWALWGAYNRLLGLAPSLTVILFGVLLCDAFRGKGGARALAWTLAASGGIVSAYALVQMFGLDPFLDSLPDNYVPSTVGHSNFLGGFLAICLPTCLGLWSQGGRERRLAQTVTIISATALIGSFSQGGWGAAAAGLALFAGVSLSGRWSRSRTVGVVAAASVAVLMVGLVALSLNNDGGGPVGGSTATRGLHWATAVDVFVDHPWIGRGPSAFLLDGPSHRSALESMWLGRDLADDPHSVPLATLVNAGAIGGLGYLLAVGWIIKRGRATRPGPLAAGALGSMGAYLVQSLVSIDVISLRVSFWICLAGLIALHMGKAEMSRAMIRRARPPAGARLVRAGAGALALCVCVVAGAAGTRILMADHHANQARQAVADARTDDAIRELEAAMLLSSMGHYRHLVGEQLTIASTKEKVRRPELLELVKGAYGEISQTPDVQWILAYAEQLDHWSTYDLVLQGEALEGYRRAQEIDPNNIFTGVRIAALQLRQDDPLGAVRTLRPYVEAIRGAPDFVPRYPEVWGALAIARWQTGDPEGARRALETGYAMDPSDCHVLIARGVLGSAFPEKGLSRKGLDLSISLACDAPSALLAELHPRGEWDPAPAAP